VRDRETGEVETWLFFGRLYRQIALGEGVNGEEANATFKDGVLTVTVPMMPRPEPKKIPVRASQS
jgi:HSP20 family molecular chaperone IbpA